jgi:hypothetical protein
MPITPLSTPPSREDMSDFSNRVDTFLSELPAFALQANALAVDVANDADAAVAAAATAINSPGTYATSVTPLTVGAGAQAPAVQAGKSFAVGQFVTIARTSAPGTWMAGQITAYNAANGAMAVNVLAFAGAGTFNDWTISISAPMQFTPATIAQIWAGLLNTVGLTPQNLFAAAAPVQLQDAATIVPDLSAGINFDLPALIATRTLGNPLNAKPGTAGMIRCRQDNVGGRALSFGSAYKFPGGAPSTTPTANATDAIAYIVWSPTLLLCTFIGNFS